MATLTALAADDSRVIRTLMVRLLTLEGYSVVTANDGFDALTRVVDIKPDIIFLDIMMPRINGYDVCSLIKNNDALKTTPVILLSSKDGLFDQAKGRLTGCNGYITKPFDRVDLHNTLHQFLGDTRQC